MYFICLSTIYLQDTCLSRLSKMMLARYCKNEQAENIQHRATRLSPKLRKKGYEYRLEKLRLTTLATRRKREDLLHFYKVLNGNDHIKWKNEPEKIVFGTIEY